tara:strand:- start:677 stop:1147 length:471 start_codon:yes stop_codon:yes gene_type:complete
MRSDWKPLAGRTGSISSIRFPIALLSRLQPGLQTRNCRRGFIVVRCTLKNDAIHLLCAFKLASRFKLTGHLEQWRRSAIGAKQFGVRGLLLGGRRTILPNETFTNRTPDCAPTTGGQQNPKQEKKSRSFHRRHAYTRSRARARGKPSPRRCRTHFC